ncbi:Dehydration-responsive element-binding protein [Stylosanthes scabra]|uniref:Dehydration-responsive element-binding protein n=1 Tax=Stylosanthes scabra TaxID=79078 RepID=A0ABU6U4I5_9FABA|nr:Dehydration-responsive element-binding protein [Stylosanthes scabra]
MGAYDQGSNNISLVPLDSSRKRKSRSRRDGSRSVAETLQKWKIYNETLQSGKEEGKPTRKAPAKGSKKGCMKGKGGPQNSQCNYRGVRQRTWGKWVAMYGSSARLNFPHITDYSSIKESMKDSSVAATTSCSSSSAATPAASDTTTISNHSEICAAEDVKEQVRLGEVNGTVNVFHQAYDSVASPTSKVKQEILEEPEVLTDPGGVEIQNLQLGDGQVAMDDVNKDQMDLSWIDNFDFESGDYLKNFSMDELFQVEELLGDIDKNPIEDSALMQALDFGQMDDKGLDFSQMNFPVDSSHQADMPSSYLYQLENPDTKLLGSLPHMEQIPLDADYGLDFLKAESEKCNNGGSGGEEHRFIDLKCLNNDPKGNMQTKKDD